MLIDISYFVGELNIPNTDSTEVQENLTLFINKYEIQILCDVLGVDLYRSFMTGLGQTSSGYSNVINGAIDPTKNVADKWKWLLNGFEYTGLDARKHKWQGFIAVQDDTSSKKSLLANGIYCQWMKDHVSFTTGATEIVAKAENAYNASNTAKVSRAWNEMSDWLHEMIWFLDTYTSGQNQIYNPEWWLQNRYYLLKTYKKMNQFGI